VSTDDVRVFVNVPLRTQQSHKYVVLWGFVGALAWVAGNRWLQNSMRGFVYCTGASTQSPHPYL
jgi:hypothetical protein